MELDDLMELDHLQDLQQSMLQDRYTHDYILGNYEDHLMIAQQDLDDQAQLTQAPAGLISSRFMQNFPDHLEHLDHSHNQLQVAELGCKLLRSSCDPYELHNDQVNCSASGTTAETGDQQAAGSRSKYQLNCTASGRSEQADDQKSAGIMASENQMKYTAAEENGDQKAAEMRSKCFKRRLEQCNLINSESDQYGDLMNDQSRLDKYSLMNDQSTDHSAAPASSEEEGGTSCCSKQEKNKMMNLERSSSITSSTTVISSNSAAVDKVRRDVTQQSTMITKRARPTAAPCINVPRPQYRLPIIIHTYSPKIIHTHPSKFMWLVQSLTGSSETRSRCLQNGQPPDQYHSIHADQDNSAAFMEAQPIANTASANSDHDQHSFHQLQYSAGSASAASMGADHHAHQQSLPSHAVIYHPKPIRYINQVNENVHNPSNHHINQSLSNLIINNNPRLISPKTPTNHPNNLINYKDHCSRMSERGCTSDTSASCCTSTTIEVTPRGNFSGSEVSPASWGPFSATELEGATAVQEELFILSRGSSACNSVPSPAPPVFENWALEHWCPDHNQTSCLSNLNNQYEADLNNLSNLTNHNLNYHSSLNLAPRDQGFSFNYPS